MNEIKEKELEKILKALANRRRLAILRCLKKSRRVSVQEIAEIIKLSFRSTSKHLGILRAVEIVEYEVISVQRFYSLSEKPGPIEKHLLGLL